MASRFQPPPILKAAENLWLALEEAVERFPARKHRYGIGKRLNDKAFEVYSLANRAWRDRRQARFLTEKLVWKVDDLKLCMRRRVVASVRAALAAWEATHVRTNTIHGTPEDFRLLQARAGSYLGHLQHANAWRLRQTLHRRFPWLATAAQPRRWSHRLEGRHLTIRRIA